MKIRHMVMSMVSVVLLAGLVYAFGATKVIDDFEKNSDLKSPEWWKFDNITATVVKNPPFRPGDPIAKTTGKYSLNIKGSAKDWYCGGVGTYIGTDATQYNSYELDVYGYGEGSGRIKIELYDDDKGSWETKYDKTWIPIKDDMWAFEQNIDWRGWKHLSIPFSSFTLTNPKRGDGILNFDQNKGSGGLLQTQIIFIANSKDGEINMNLDNIKLTAGSNSSDDE